jgi:hypothetical protein
MYTILFAAGPMVWYQMFEYAIGHWLQKATEHMIGCVLCSPGCFSLFRGKALMDDNVMRKYTTASKEARHYVQYDQGACSYPKRDKTYSQLQKPVTWPWPLVWRDSFKRRPRIYFLAVRLPVARTRLKAPFLCYCSETGVLPSNPIRRHICVQVAVLDAPIPNPKDKVKVKQYLDRVVRTLRVSGVWGSQTSRKPVRKGHKVVRPTHQPA